MDIHERMREAARKQEEQDRFRRRLESTDALLGAESQRRDELKKHMQEEHRDLERLDRIGLVNLWHSIRGSKEEAKEKEMQEYMAAKLNYDKAEASVQALARDSQRLRQELADGADIANEYRQALRAKEEFILRSGGSAGANIFALDEEHGRLKAKIQELQEAIDAGDAAHQALLQVEKNLNSAGNWGILDILGGGLLVTAVKHSSIHEARRELQNAQDLLRCFQRELLDVKTVDAVDIGSLSTAADFLLDGFIFDLIVQSQINSARERIRQTVDKVDTERAGLQHMLEQTRKQLQELGLERNRIIEKG